MRHIRYKKPGVGWIELRGNASKVESCGSWDNGPTWPWDESPHKSLAAAESYWDGLEGYTKTVLNEGDTIHPALKLKAFYNDEPIPISNKHKCVCKWEVVYREGCRCGGI